MCGIAFLAVPPSTFKLKTLKKVRDSLLLSIEHRGRDATGVAVLYKPHYENTAWYSKNNVPATTFIKNADLVGSTMVLHTRNATQGSPTDPNNNHPILTEYTLGVHNGMLMSDTVDAAKLGLTKQYEVDSELLFRLIDDSRKDGNYSYRKKWWEIKGDATIAWIDLTTQELHFVALGGRPLVVGDVYSHGNKVGVVGASTKEALEKLNEIPKFRVTNIHNADEKVEHVYNIYGVNVKTIKCSGLSQRYNPMGYMANGGTFTRPTWTSNIKGITNTVHNQRFASSDVEFWDREELDDYLDDYYEDDYDEWFGANKKQLTQTTSSNLMDMYKTYPTDAEVPLDIRTKLQTQVNNLVKNGVRLEDVSPSPFQNRDFKFGFITEKAQQHKIAYSEAYQMYMFTDNEDKTMIYVPLKTVAKAFEVSK